MSDYDEYFTDDGLLDDQTLAILDHEERKFLNQSNIYAPPPSKRQRTDYGWTVGTGLQRADSNASDTLPEISLEPDGSYGVLRASQTQNPTESFKLARHISSASTRRTMPPPGRPSGARNLESNGDTSFVTPTSAMINSTTSVPHSKAQLDLQKQLQQLQERLEELNQDNERIQSALKEAQSLRMIKEGEVTVLRKNAEKVSRDHAAQILHLKAEREEVDAKQARMQKEMKEEVERLRTQFVFKQHEQESARKALQSTRPRSTYQRRQVPWESPSASRTDVAVVTIPSVHPEGSKDVQASQTKRAGALPGFQNAFNEATPLPLSKKRLSKSKFALLDDSPSQGIQLALDFSSQNTHLLSKEANVIPNSNKDETHFQLNLIPDPDPDVEMQPQMSNELGIIDEIGNDLEVEGCFAEIPDRKREMNRIILIHYFPPCTTLTIQLLLGAAIPSEVSEDISKPYFAACTRILEVIARVHDGEDWQYTIECISRSLISMIPILVTAHSFSPLAALLNLLGVLIYAFPDFGPCTLSQSLDAQSSDASILVHLCTIILEYDKVKIHPSYEILVTEAVRTIGALSLIVDDEIADKLAYVPKNQQILLSLFRSNQPPSFLAQSSQLLVLLASHRKLCRYLLSTSDTDPSVEHSRTHLYKIPIIEHMCSYLIDFGPKDTDHKDTKTLVLDFFSLLSTSDSDVHIQLVSSTSVVPSLVCFLSHLTSAFWEDDADLLSASSEEVSLAINTLNQTLFLLHHLVFAQTPSLNLRQKLSAPHSRLFNGLLNTFVVTFGRLSYGEAPKWIDRQGRIDLLSLTDMARDILDHVIDGPEADLTWQAYQLDSDDVDDMDDETEENLLGKRE